ncbi:MAG: hypothetical protein AAB288_08050, partial [Acidobacteriota bacterium]
MNRVGLASCILWALASAGAVRAQGGSTNSAPSAEKLAVTPGGVDMRTGHHSYKATDLTIGAGAPGDLSLARMMSLGIPGHVEPFANFANNWDIMLTEKRINISEHNFQHGSGIDYELGVRYGGRSETFRGYSSYTTVDQVSMNPYTKLTWTGDRTSAGAVYTYQATDGTIVTFRPIGNGDCSSFFRCAYASQIVEPGGIKYTLEYDSSGPARLRSVASSRGYAMLLEYSGTNVTKACVINLAHTVKPSNNVCPSNAPATTTYTYTTFAGATKLASVTDAAGNISSFA